jgi:phosphopantetheine adenylyltransferase
MNNTKETFMKLVLIFLVGISAISANAEVLKASGFSAQKTIAIGLKSDAIADAKEKLLSKCLENRTEEVCANMKFEVNKTKVITHRQCGGTIFGPDGRCSYVEAEVWGRL